MKKLNCYHVDTCLPDYWPGHHLPHISIPAYRMSFKELKSCLHSEVNQSAIAGSFDHALLDNELFYKRLHAAIDRITPAIKHSKICFSDINLPEEDNNEDFNYAYFIFDEA